MAKSKQIEAKITELKQKLAAVQKAESAAADANLVGLAHKVGFEKVMAYARSLAPAKTHAPAAPARGTFTH